MHVIATRRWVVAAVVAVLAATTRAPAAHALNVGVNAGFPMLNSSAPLNRALLSLHARQWREELQYRPSPPGSAPRPGPLAGRPFSSPSIARAVRYAMDHRARVLVTLDLPDGLTPHTVDAQGFAAFVDAIARYFRPGGPFEQSLTCAERSRYPDYLPDLELLNEPYLQSDSTPADYARIVQLASSRIRQASPDFRIVIAGDTLQIGSGENFVAGLYAAGLTNDMFDLVTVHPYGWDAGRTTHSPPDDYNLQRLTRVIQSFRQAGFRGRFILSEHGSPSAGYTVSAHARQDGQVLPRYGGLAGQLRFWQESVALFEHNPLYRRSLETVYAYNIADEDGSGATADAPVWAVPSSQEPPSTDPANGLFTGYFGLFGWKGRPGKSALLLKPAGEYLASLMRRSTLPRTRATTPPVECPRSASPAGVSALAAGSGSAATTKDLVEDWRRIGNPVLILEAPIDLVAGAA